MPNTAFVFPEAVITITPLGAAAQTVAYATSMSEDATPVILEDGSMVFKRVRFQVETVWVDDDIKTIKESQGPFDVFVTWTNEDDLRLRSAGLEDASLTGIALRGALEGGAQVYSLTFEGLSRT